MAFDPFSRGRFPVGARTTTWTDSRREGRLLPVEIWYPASEEFRGQDLDPQTRDRYELVPGLPPGTQSARRDATPRAGSFPLIIFSHGFGGHRRQSTFLCTHWASHGYVVAAMDHTGNTIFEMFQMMMAAQMGQAPPDPATLIPQLMGDRPLDVSFVIDRMLEQPLADAGCRVDGAAIGMSGHSFGGWTTLMATARDRRIRAALPLAPAGGWSPLPGEALGQALDFAWGRDVPTLFLVAELDTLLPLRGMHELFEKTQSAKRMIVLQNADHMHFCDEVEQIHELFRMMPPPVFDKVAKDIKPIAELCSGESAYRFARTLGLAHMDAHLKGDRAARQFLEDNVVGALSAREVVARVA
jgi:dienelactone hydrolase